MWSSLIRVSIENDDLALYLITLGHTLASMVEWQSFIHEELCSWITIFFAAYVHQHKVWVPAEQYASVLSQIWHPDPGEYEFHDNTEKTFGLTLTLLSKMWEDLDFAVSSPDKLVQMLRCTSWAVLRRNMKYWRRMFSDTNVWRSLSDSSQLSLCPFMTLLPML
jgi:hypothetical protein